MKLAFQSKMPTRLPYVPVIFALAGINLSMLLLILFIRPNLPPELPLLYGMPQGEDQLMPSLFLIVPTIVSLVTVVVNTILIKSVKDIFLQQILVGIAGAATLLSTITTTKILLIVGNF